MLPQPMTLKLGFEEFFKLGMDGERAAPSMPSERSLTNDTTGSEKYQMSRMELKKL